MHNDLLRRSIAMLFLISSAPDTKEFETAFRTAKEMNGQICLLQDAVYAARNAGDDSLYVIADDMRLRGISDNEISGRPIDYGQLTELMVDAEKVAGLF
jgi:sulfur relay protein TusB/DsrH